MDELWQRLKQRKLVQWALAYVAFAFAFLQGIDVVAQQFGWPESLRRGITLALVVGFFVALVLAWYHGERGSQRVGGTELVIIALLLAIGGGVLWLFARVPAKLPVAESLATSARSPPTASGPGTLLASVVADIPENSVAVLPFANEGEQSQQFFSDGLSEDLINALSQFAGLKVISRNSAFQFRESKQSSAKIGQLLGVAHLLEGSVQRAGDEVRITATLVNASDGSIVWSARYDKPYQDLFALQDAITQAVAGALKAKLLTDSGAVMQSDRPPSGNLDAYTAYQRGVSYIALNNETGLRRAIAAFNDATRLDPRYAAAYARLSLTWTLLISEFLGGVEARQAYANARGAADTALKLDPDSSLAHQARASLLLNADANWTGSEAEYQRALQLTPNDAEAQFGLGNVLAGLGQVRQAVALTRKALAADPRHAGWYYWISIYFAALDQLDSARTAAETAIALQPAAVAYHDLLVIIEVLRGDAKGALAAAQQESPGPWHDTAIARALQLGADRVAADAALKLVISKDADVSAYQIAEIYALRRDPGNTFRWLDRAWANRDPGIQFLLYDPFILRYRSDPRFAAFCKTVGLPNTTDAVAMK